MHINVYVCHTLTLKWLYRANFQRRRAQNLFSIINCYINNRKCRPNEVTLYI